MGAQTRTDNLPCTFLIPVLRFFMPGTCKSGAVPWADNSLASIVVLAATLGRESQSPTKGDKWPRLRFTSISPPCLFNKSTETPPERQHRIYLSNPHAMLAGEISSSGLVSSTGTVQVQYRTVKTFCCLRWLLISGFRDKN